MLLRIYRIKWWQDLQIGYFQLSKKQKIPSWEIELRSLAYGANALSGFLSKIYSPVVGLLILNDRALELCAEDLGYIPRICIFPLNGNNKFLDNFTKLFDCVKIIMTGLPNFYICWDKWITFVFVFFQIY